MNITSPNLRIRAREQRIIKAGTGCNIPVMFSRPLVLEALYLVYPSRRYFNLSIGTIGSVLAVVVRADEAFLPFSNFSYRDIIIREAEELGIILIHNDLRPLSTLCLLIEAIFKGLPSHDEADTTDLLFDVQPPEDLADVSQARVSSDWGPEYEGQVRALLEKHRSLFRPELGSFNDGIEMPIPFRDDVDLSKLKQSPYNLSLRDQEAINKVIDPLVEQGRVKRVPLGKPSAAASPAFMVWKKGKPRVVVDLRKVNSALYPDAYSLPK